MPWRETVKMNMFKRDYLGKMRGNKCGLAIIAVVMAVLAAGILPGNPGVQAAAKVSSGNTFVAEDGNTYTYTLYDDDTAKIMYCNAANPVIVVPEVVDGYPVTGFGLSTYTTKMIPNSVTEITSLYINSPYIQNYAFASSDLHIGTLTIGDAVTSYGISIFSGNTIDVLNYNATNASNSGTGTPLGSDPLQTNPTTVIGHLSIGDNVQKIPGHMFCNVALEQDELEIHAATVGSYAFESHGIHIRNFTLTDDVKTCGYFVTSYCTIDHFYYNITDMSYTQSLNSMFGGGNGAITTTHIGELHIGSNVKSIPEMAFKYIALDQEELVLDMEKISNEAFRGNDIHIGRLVIGEHVTKMGYGMTESVTIGTLDYNAASAAGSSAYGVFGPTYSGRRHTVAGTVNIGEGVKSIPRSCFENMSIGTVNYNAVSSTYKGSESFSMFQNSDIGQVNFGDRVTAIPAYMLKKSAVGNEDIVVPESVTSIGSQWATDVTADGLVNMYVYANTRSSSPTYIGMEYPNLFIHRGSGFYDYFTHTHSGTIHQEMELHVLCDGYMGGVEYEDDSGVRNGCRRRNCTECGYEFDKEYLIELTAGNGVSSVSGGGYYAQGDTAEIDCAVEDGMLFSGWTDTVEDTAAYGDKAVSLTVGTKARSFRADAGSAAAFKVEWIDHDGTVLKSETVEYGEDAEPPDDPEWEGHEFIGWDMEYANVTEDLEIKALYDDPVLSVTFKDADGHTIKKVFVSYGEDAQPPEDPEMEGYEFAGWDGDYRNVTEDRVVTAMFSPLPPESGPEEPDPGTGDDPEPEPDLDPPLPPPLPEPEHVPASEPVPLPASEPLPVPPEDEDDDADDDEETENQHTVPGNSEETPEVTGSDGEAPLPPSDRGSDDTTDVRDDNPVSDDNGDGGSEESENDEPGEGDDDEEPDDDSGAEYDTPEMIHPEIDNDSDTDEDKPVIPPIVPIGAAGGTGTGAWYFFWWRRRRKIRGCIIDKEGNPVEGLRVVIAGKQVLEAVTDKNGEYSFKRVKGDVLEYHVYDGQCRAILSLEIATKEKAIEDIFEVISNDGCDVEYDKSGKTLFVDVTVPVLVRETLETAAEVSEDSSEEFVRTGDVADAGSDRMADGDPEE